MDKIGKGKILCSEQDCFNDVDIGEIVRMADGSEHPVSLKCWTCRTDADKTRLKNYLKKLRKKANK